jgi:folate-binding protein YgfZ
MNIEYRIIAETAGYADYSGHGRLEIEGPDSVTFLQALVTNDLSHIERGQGVYALYLTPQGRMIADLEVLHRGTFLCCGTAPGLALPLATRLDQLIFAEDTRVTDISARQTQVCIVGGTAAAIVAGLFDLDPHVVDTLRELAQIDIEGGFLYRSGGLKLPSYQIVLPAHAHHDLVARLREAGLAAVTPHLLESLRIADARPVWGVDMTETTIPLEAGLLDRAISTTKGCYVGQEVIIRVLHRGGGRVARRLMQLVSEGTSLPHPHDAIESPSGGPIGHLTSIGGALESDGWIALGYLVREAAELGSVVRIPSTGATARVTGFAR